MLFALKIDGPLVIGLALISAYGLVVLYSASGQSMPTVLRTVARLALGTAAMLLLAQINPNFLRRSTPWLYLGGCFLLVVVAAIGHIGMGAQRWLDLGIFRFQPSELMKLAVPMMCAWYLHERPLPPSWTSLAVLTALIMVPVALVVVQPDLGTAALIGAGGALVIILAGLRLRVMAALLGLAAVGAWFGWSFMHDYQRKRVLTFLNPQTDPLGAGYHIIQSQIAIGSGGVFGKGWMNGSQAQLEFLPERSTDFIFAVIGEEFGLLGLLVLLVLYVFVRLARRLPRHADAGHVRTPARRESRAHLLRLCVHQRGYGDRTAAGGGRAAAAGQLWRQFGRDAAGRVRYSHGAVFTA